MDLLTELVRNDLDPALLASVRALRERAERIITAKKSIIEAANAKNSTLKVALARHRHAGLTSKSEVPTIKQGALFEKIWYTNLVLMAEELAIQSAALTANNPKP